MLVSAVRAVQRGRLTCCGSSAICLRRMLPPSFSTAAFESVFIPFCRLRRDA